MLISIADSDVAACGGKAAGLQALMAAGLPVPAGTCLPADVYRRALPAQHPDRDVALRAIVEACRPIYKHLDAWWPEPELERELDGAIERLGKPLIVRSSATCEDLRGSSAAGVFTSVVDVWDRQQLVGAIRCCWRSMWEPAAWATLRARGSTPAREAMAVVLQRQIVGRWAGLVLSSAPQGSTDVYIEAVPGRADALASGATDPHTFTLPREGPVPEHFLLPIALLQQLRKAAIDAEAALGATVELEWLYDEDDRLWLVQARAQRPTRLVGSDPTDWSRPAHERVLWRWDREHNPDPLSPAHVSLVRHLDQALPNATSLTVIEGYLYEAVTTKASAVQTTKPAMHPKDIDPDRFHAELRALQSLIEAQEATVPAEPLAQLDHALAALTEFYERYVGVLGPLRRAARERLFHFLRERLDPAHAGSSEYATIELVSTLSLGQTHDALARSAALHQLAESARNDATLAQWIERDARSPSLPTAVSAYLQRWGKLAPRWDVAEATLAEHPEWLRASLRAALRQQTGSEPPELPSMKRQTGATATLDRLLAELGRADRRRAHELVRQARLARESAEDDDVLFARALWLVRSALLKVARHHVDRDIFASRDQIFGLSIDAVRQSLRPNANNRSLLHAAEAGLARWRQQRSRVPPLTVRGKQCTWPMAPRDAIVRGLGTGGVAQGRVCLIGDVSELLGRDLSGRVAVCSTLIPSLAIVLPQLAALVTDHGGLLSHAASLAREMGLPAVVGTQSATQRLRDGEYVWVDGPSGRVVRLND